MPNELEWQRRIIKSVKVQGGYGKKWSSQYTVGAPDLVLTHPLIGTFIMEVKLWKRKRYPFHGKVDTTPKQRHELKSFVDAGALALVGLVIEMGRGTAMIVALDHSTEQFHSNVLSGISSRVQSNIPHSSVGWLGNPKSFDVVSLMQEYEERYRRDE